MRCVKVALRIWNKKVFGDVHLKVPVAKDVFDRIQYGMESQGPSMESIRMESEARVSLFGAFLGSRTVLG